jgi:hypothetical protein
MNYGSYATAQKSCLLNNRGDVFCVKSVSRGYRKDKEEAVEFREASLPGNELGSGGVELSN